MSRAFFLAVYKEMQLKVFGIIENRNKRYGLVGTLSGPLGPHIERSTANNRRGYWRLLEATRRRETFTEYWRPLSEAPPATPLALPSLSPIMHAVSEASPSTPLAASLPTTSPTSHPPPASAGERD